MEHLLAEAYPVLVEQILGTSDAGAIQRAIGEEFPGARVFDFELSVGALFGLELPDGTRVALKLHQPTADRAALEGQQHVQEHLAACGYPAPRPIGDLREVLGRPATAEEWRDEGERPATVSPERRRALAQALAELIRLTDELLPLPLLAGGQSALWPKPHNALFDFDATAKGAEWIDEIAARAWPLMRRGPLVLAHSDWSIKHFRFVGDRIVTVYDWDSISVDNESVPVGGAAATYTAALHVDEPWTPRVEDAVAFIDDYERSRDQPFEDEERLAAGARAVYLIAYTSRCEHSLDTRPHAPLATGARSALRAFARELLP